MRTTNLVGNKYCNLLVIELAYKKEYDKYWKCLCDCGNYHIVRSDALTTGNTKSCGCLFFMQENIIGKTFNKLTVINKTDIKRGKSYVYVCQCECGKLVNVAKGHLKSGHTKSCGCLMRGTKHYKYKDGKSSKYSYEFTSKRETIRNRDNRKCQFPNCDYDDSIEKRSLDVHHIDGNRYNNKDINLISLCRKHHMSIEQSGPRIWYDYFTRITESYGSY